MKTFLRTITPWGVAAILYSLAYAATHTLGPIVTLQHSLAGKLLLVVGIALIAWSMHQFALHRTTIIPVGQPSALLTRGPYAFSRNPIYLADLVLVIGLALYLGHVWYWIVVPVQWTVFQFVYIPPEEERMRATFGDAYTAYCQRVRRWL